jgi:hypothetical protein
VSWGEVLGWAILVVFTFVLGFGIGESHGRQRGERKGRLDAQKDQRQRAWWTDAERRAKSELGDEADRYDIERLARDYYARYEREWRGHFVKLDGKKVWLDVDPPDSIFERIERLRQEGHSVEPAEPWF